MESLSQCSREGHPWNVCRDIEQSTALWESLDESVMDRAIALHHTCMRALIMKHMGYEAQMEGDSFCVAFHDAHDASDFCIAVQVRLGLMGSCAVPSALGVSGWAASD